MFHRSIERRVDPDGNMRYLTSLEPGDTAECSVAILTEYLSSGWTVVQALHANEGDENPGPVNRFLVEYVGED